MHGLRMNLAGPRLTPLHGFLHGVVSSTWSFMTFIPCFFLLIKTSSAEGRRGGREEGAGGKRAKGEGILVEVQECGENIKE